MLMLLLLLLFLSFLLIFLVAVKLFLSDSSLSSYTREEASSYECGFEQYSLSRIPFSIRYFTLTLVFLIFDLEVMLLIFTPSELFLLPNNSLIVFISILFILLLFLGLLYEWYDGSLDWVL